MPFFNLPESFRKATDRLGQVYLEADRNLSGILPGGVPVLSNLVRSRPFQALRNAALDKFEVGLPERTFIKAMTGGDKLGTTELNPEQLSRLKQAYNDQKGPSNAPKKPEPEYSDDASMKYYNDNLADYNSPIVSTYGNITQQSPYGRDLKMTLGNLQMTPTEEGGMDIYDRWDVDPDDVATNAPETGLAGQNSTFDRILDLTEGGPIPSLVTRAAQHLDTYEPIEIRQNIPADEWQSIEAKGLPLGETLVENQEPSLQYANDLYKKIKGLF